MAEKTDTSTGLHSVSNIYMFIVKAADQLIYYFPHVWEAPTSLDVFLNTNHPADPFCPWPLYSNPTECSYMFLIFWVGTDEYSFIEN